MNFSVPTTVPTQLASRSSAAGHPESGGLQNRRSGFDSLVPRSPDASSSAKFRALEPNPAAEQERTDPLESAPRAPRFRRSVPRTVPRIAALAGAALVLAAPAAAHAGTLGVQSDNVIVDGTPAERARAFAEAKRLGAKWVRIMIRDDLLGTDRLDAAVSEAHANGFHVIGTLMRWKGMDGTDRPAPTVSGWQRFARQAVARYGRFVSAWSTMNEPNHPAFSPRTGTTCRVDTRSATSAHSVEIQNGKRVIVSYRRTKRGRGTHRKLVRYRRDRKGYYRRYRGVRRTRTGRRVRRTITLKRRVERDGRLRTRRLTRRQRRGLRRWHARPVGRWYERRVTYRRTRSKQQRRRHGRYRRVERTVPLTTRQTISVSTPYQVTACEQQALGAAYRGIHDAAAAEIRAGDPSALVITGDLGPHGANRDFMAAMLAAEPGPVDADIVGIHPYWNGSANAQRTSGAFALPDVERIPGLVAGWHARGDIRNRTGGQPAVWATEFGALHGDHDASWLRAALDRLSNAGIGLVVYYELRQGLVDGAWDSGLLDRYWNPRPVWTAAHEWSAR